MQNSSNAIWGASKHICPNCGRKMKQQFIGLFHCKCGTSWRRDIGFFERTPDMVFSLERKKVGNKIKQLLKKEGGFTLVELLAVIAILGIIVAISIPLVGNVIDDSREKTANSQNELVINAAQLYFVQNDTADEVDVETLVSDGYLTENPKSGDYTEDAETISREVALGKSLPE